MFVLLGSWNSVLYGKDFKQGMILYQGRKHGGSGAVVERDERDTMEEARTFIQQVFVEPPNMSGYSRCWEHSSGQKAFILPYW